MRLSLVRSWVEERKLRIFDNIVIVIVLATLVTSLAAVLFAALALPGTRVFVSLISFSVQFHRGYQRVG
jgi:nicotinamide riboside transporter PnuC